MPDFQLNSFLAASQLCLQIVVAMERIKNNSNSCGFCFLVFFYNFCISLSVYDLDVHFLCSFLCRGSLLDIANSSCSASADEVPSTLW